MRKKYKTVLPEEVRALIPIKQLVEARKYNRGQSNLDFAHHLITFAFMFTVILLDFPAFVWYGWLDVLRDDGYCGGDSGTTYDIYYQLALGTLFYITLLSCQVIFRIPFTLAEHCYEKS